MPAASRNAQRLGFGTMGEAFRLFFDLKACPV